MFSVSCINIALDVLLRLPVKSYKINSRYFICHLLSNLPWNGARRGLARPWSGLPVDCHVTLELVRMELCTEMAVISFCCQTPWIKAESLALQSHLSFDWKPAVPGVQRKNRHKQKLMALTVCLHIHGENVGFSGLASYLVCAFCCSTCQGT